MAGVAAGGPAAGSRLETELGYGLPVGSRLIGTPRVDIGASETGRAYRLGYGLTVAQGGALHVELAWTPTAARVRGWAAWTRGCSAGPRWAGKTPRRQRARRPGRGRGDADRLSCPDVDVRAPAARCPIGRSSPLEPTQPRPSPCNVANDRLRHRLIGQRPSVDSGRLQALRPAASGLAFLEISRQPPPYGGRADRPRFGSIHR